METVGGGGLGRGSWRGRFVAAVIGVALATAPPAASGIADEDGPPPPRARIEGASAGDLAGASVAAAGDVNGDGHVDVIVGAPAHAESSGIAYVVFGPFAPDESIGLDDLGDRGFAIEGRAPEGAAARRGCSPYRAGTSVSGAGDVNADGLDDVVVGAPWAPICGGRGGGGVAFVVFGSQAPDSVDLGALGDDGFAIRGPHGGDAAGTAVSAAGDVNGDGRDDVIVGAPDGPPSGRYHHSGRAFVVFGRDSSSSVDLRRLVGRGFGIVGAYPGDQLGQSVSDAGDVNGDGLDDVIAGAPYHPKNDNNPTGAAYVIFGTQTPARVYVDALGNRGLAIDGGFGGHDAGAAVGAAGDVNGDGLDDVLVGAPQFYVCKRAACSANSAYVIFGTPLIARIDLRSLGPAGYKLEGPPRYEGAGISVAGGNDVNGDGHDDVLVGALSGVNADHVQSGVGYVAYGKATTETLQLRDLGANGYRTDGSDAHSAFGASVDGLGDVNGDGAPDFVIGAPSSDGPNPNKPGSVYIVFGSGS